MKDWPVYLAILILFLLLLPMYEGLVAGLDTKQIEKNDNEIKRIASKRYNLKSPESVI